MSPVKRLRYFLKIPSKNWQISYEKILAYNWKNLHTLLFASILSIIIYLYSEVNLAVTKEKKNIHKFYKN